MTTTEKPPIYLLSFGEILWDVIEGQSHLGGAALNLAAHAARLGMEARLISCVGDDELGRRALSEASGLGVDASGVGTHPTSPTGTVQVRLVGGQPEYTILEPVAWDFIPEAPFPPGDAHQRPVDVVCFGTLAQRGSTSRQSLRALLDGLADTPAFYDVNLRQNFYTRDVIEWGLRRARVVKVNDTEAETLAQLLRNRAMTAPEFARAVRDHYGVEVALVTLGADGCLVADPDGVTHVPGQLVTVVDTVGAGDAFSAGFLSAWLRGHSPTEAAVIGNTLGSYVATQSGAVPPYSPELRALLGDLVTG